MPSDIDISLMSVEVKFKSSVPIEPGLFGRSAMFEPASAPESEQSPREGPLIRNARRRSGAMYASVPPRSFARHVGARAELSRARLKSSSLGLPSAERGCLTA